MCIPKHFYFNYTVSELRISQLAEKAAILCVTTMM